MNRVKNHMHSTRVGATGTSCERMWSEPTRATRSAKGSVFMRAVGSVRSFLLDGELEEPC